MKLDGTETQWIYYSANDVWARPYLTFTNKKIGESNNTANALCNKAKSISWEEMYQNIDEVSVFTYEGDNRISIAIKKEDLETQDVEGVKKYFQKNNMIVEYNLAKEEVEPYTPEQQEAYNKLQNVLSYYNEINVFTDKALLVFKYIADTTEKIENEGNVYSRPILRLEKTICNEVDIMIEDVRFQYDFNDEEYVEIDCEEKEVKYEGLNRNRKIQIGYEFPKLKVGENKIKMYGGDCIIKAKRKDRWL